MTPLMPKLPFRICMKLRSTALCSKFPLFYPNECFLGVPLQPEDQDQTIDQSRPEDIYLAMNIHLAHHHHQEDDLQGILLTVG